METHCMAQSWVNMFGLGSTTYSIHGTPPKNKHLNQPISKCDPHLTTSQNCHSSIQSQRQCVAHPRFGTALPSFATAACGTPFQWARPPIWTCQWASYTWQLRQILGCCSGCPKRSQKKHMFSRMVSTISTILNIHLVTSSIPTFPSFVGLVY